MLNRRQGKRFRGRVDVEFMSNGKTFRGTSSDFSLNGLFIVATDAKAPGTVLDIIIHLPDGSTSKVRGKVRRFSKTVAGDVIGTPDGMGVEIMEKDPSYLHFFRSLLVTTEKDSSPEATQMDVKPLQHRNEKPIEIQAGENQEARGGLHGRPHQPISGQEKKHPLSSDPGDKKRSIMSFDEMLLELISAKLNI